MRVNVISTLAAATLAGSALAGIPIMQVAVSSSSGASGTAVPVGTPSGAPNQYSYSGVVSAAGFVSNFNLVAVDTEASSRAVLGGQFSIVNTAATVQTFTVDISASTVAQGPSSLTGGSVSGVLTGNGDGGFFGSNGSQSIWNAFIRTGGTSNPVASLLNSPYSVTSAANMVASIPGQSFGTPIPNLPSIAMGDAVALRLVFQLGAGDSLDLTTAFVVQAVPAPGVVAMLAIAGLRARRRR